MASGSIPVEVFSKDYVFDPRPRFPFRIVAKRYWIGELDPDADDNDIFSKTREDVRTLVLMHGVAAHKEHWEPTIQWLFENERALTAAPVRLRDMWSIDLPNHGDSAVLNEEVLRWGYETFSGEDHARALHAFLAGLGTGVDVDFSKRRLSLVGHSMGGAVVTLTSTYYPLLKISSFHLFEPYLVGEEGLTWISFLVELSEIRDDTWPSAEAAYQFLKGRRSFAEWDDRILDILIKYGLRPLPTAEYPDKTEGVTLKCTRKQQAATYRERRSCGILYRYLRHVLKQIPTHIVYGTIMDGQPDDVRQDVLHVASGGISNFASVTTVPGAGHMMLETHPDVVADLVWKQLGQSYTRPRTNGTVAAKL